MQNPLFNAKAPPINMRQDGNPVCSKCGNPIEAGEIATWENGCEDHGSCPSRQDHGWDNPLMMPKQPGQRPQQSNGQRPDSQETIRQLSSRKSAAANTPWDVFLNGRWINRVFTEPNISTEMVKQSLVNHEGYNPAIEVQPGTVQVPGNPLNRIGSWERIGIRKKHTGARSSNAFGVPCEHAIAVAIALAEEGVRNFEEVMDHDLGLSYFAFSSPTEKEVAADIVAEKFAPEISVGKGTWKDWQSRNDLIVPHHS